MILTIFTAGLLAIILKRVNPSLFNYVCQTLTLSAFAIIFACILLKTCEKEYELEAVKHAQWKFERETGLPYTSFRGE